MERISHSYEIFYSSGGVRVYGITVIEITFKAGFRDFNQNQIGIRYFKPFEVTEK